MKIDHHAIADYVMLTLDQLSEGDVTIDEYLARLKAFILESVNCDET